jgi:hypothetical protein|nr:MAG TPA: hypothetical protein [Caudoviricetes sp.]
MKNIVRNFSVAIVVSVTMFITIYYSIVYATKKQIMFDNSDILMIIFFGLLSLAIIFMLLYINSKLNAFSNALVDISDKIDISEENVANLERSTQRIILKEIKGNREFKEKILERMDYEKKSEQQSKQKMG